MDTGVCIKYPSLEELVFTCQAFFSLKIGFDCNPDTIAFNEEKFFSTRNSYQRHKSE